MDNATPQEPLAPAEAPDTPITDAPATPAPEAGAPEGTAPATPETPASPEAIQAAIEEIEGLLEDKPFKVRADLKLPWKRGTETGHATLGEMRSSFMMKRDLDAKYREHAARARQFEAERRQHGEAEARFKALQQSIERDKELWLKAQSDPEARERLERHWELSATDPEYRRTWERAREADVYDAEKSYAAEQQQAEYVQAVAADANDYIDSTAGDYPGVDPDRVRRAYAELWIAADRIQDPKAREQEHQRLVRSNVIDRLYQQEAQAYEKLTQPLQTELSTLKAELAAMKAEMGTKQHNARTSAAIQRTRGNPPPGGKPAGNPPAPGVPSSGTHPGDREARRREWIAAG